VTAKKAYPLGCSQMPPAYYDYEHLVAFPPTTTTVPVQTRDDYLLTRRLGTGKFSDVFEAVDVQAEKRLVLDKNNNQPHDDERTGVVDPRTMVVVKCLKPVTERKIRREILVLERACQLPNLARLLAIVMSPEYYHHHGKDKDDHQHRPRPMPALVLQHAGPRAQWLCHGVHDSWPTTTATCPTPPPLTKGENPTKTIAPPLDPSFVYLTDYEIRYYICHLLMALDGLHAAGIVRFVFSLVFCSFFVVWLLFLFCIYT
jgi:serine/threonine protein kinase